MHSLKTITDTYQHHQRPNVFLDVKSGQYQQASPSPVFQNVKFSKLKNALPFLMNFQVYI